MASSAEMSSAEMSSPAMSSSDMSSAGSASVTEPSVSPSSEASSGGSATASKGAAGFDVKTTTWFTAFCSGFATAAVANKTVDPLLKGKVTAATKPLLVAAYKVSAADFTATSKALAKLPAPTITGGTTLATEVPKALDAVATTISSLETETAAVDAAKDPSQLVALAQAKQPTLTSQAQAIVAPIAALDTETQENLLKIPACAQLQKIVQG